MFSHEILHLDGYLVDANLCCRAKSRPLLRHAWNRGETVKVCVKSNLCGGVVGAEIQFAMQPGLADTEFVADAFDGDAGYFGRLFESEAAEVAHLDEAGFVRGFAV